jgi:chromatin assembly factor 1 subunit B
MVHPQIPSPAALIAAQKAAGESGIMAATPHPPRVEYMATLSRHSGVINVVKFCPRGELLATAGDGELCFPPVWRRASVGLQMRAS